MHTLQQLRSGELKGIKKLIVNCGLTSFPEEIFTLAENLEILDLSDNQLSSLPNEIVQLTKLKILFLGNNLFTQFPEVLAELPHLSMISFKSNRLTHISETALPVTTRWLVLTNNHLTELPKSIGRCSALEKLTAAGNRLKVLPEELSNCKNLGLLRVSANQLTKLPQWLLQDMPKLSWLSFAGNPFNTGLLYRADMINDNTVQKIDWQQLTMMHQLGEGASGIISKALWQQSGLPEKEVAVKLFKGSVTSDGYPEDEMAACIQAGKHTNLVKLLGEISDHPEQKQGLVLDLMPAAFYNLGLPPSYDSCTRDVFADGTKFTIQQVLAVVKAIASVAAHLHKQGIVHGDLYAHNTLINKDNEVLFSDFGAATMYDITNAELAAKLQRLDVSAFGCMIEDLLSCTKATENDADSMNVLVRLKDAAMQPEVLKRPGFEEICKVLNDLQGA